MEKKPEIVIKPKKGLANLDFAELWRYRDLFYFFAWRDIKIRYKQTVLGIAWAVLQPFVMMVVFTVIFGKLAGISSDNIPYPIFSYAGLLLWNVFSTSLNNASQSLVGSANIIQKVYLPKIIIPAASIIVSLIDFCFSALIFGGILIYYGFMPRFEGLILLPLLLLIAIGTALGLGSFFAALNVKYRDIRYALPFFIQMLIFVTPVIYPVSVVPLKYRPLLALNPMTGVIETFKAGFLGTVPINWTILIISVAASILFLFFGLWYFLKTEKTFADVI
jgi:lipopolysaccharide transport system permease protein